ncbi:hypothetical protein Ddye_017303 [Dipteronia dyeriana]|uniref:ABC transmembrane type-1 domain-containing protein n=1 Tax=Dipteronia dyeriana TaxID=168575 RepID=A0AAD9WZN2_9ROSI|nr:hypothetical protein Ddye_017303 [Dipteronia dyeriana]
MESIENMQSVSLESEHSQEYEKIKTDSFHKLFTFVDISDVALMILGTIGALNNGVSMLLMAIIVGDLVDSFGKNQNSTDIVDVVSKVKILLHEFRFIIQNMYSELFVIRLYQLELGTLSG